jgi:hypothetical protein
LLNGQAINRLLCDSLAASDENCRNILCGVGTWGGGLTQESNTTFSAQLSW